MQEPRSTRRDLLERKVLAKLRAPVRYSPEVPAKLSDLIESVKAWASRRLKGYADVGYKISGGLPEQPCLIDRRAPPCEFVPASNAGQPWCSKVGRHAVDSSYLVDEFESGRIAFAFLMRIC